MLVETGVARQLLVSGPSITGHGDHERVFEPSVQAEPSRYFVAIYFGKPTSRRITSGSKSEAICRASGPV
jgi:hypothetical protein